MFAFCQCSRFYINFMPNYIMIFCYFVIFLKVDDPAEGAEKLAVDLELFLV